MAGRSSVPLVAFGVSAAYTYSSDGYRTIIEFHTIYIYMHVEVRYFDASKNTQNLCTIPNTMI